MRLAALGLATAMALSAAPVRANEFLTLKGHGGPIMGLSVASDGSVASASFDNSVGYWNGLTPTWLEAHDAAVVDVVFSDDGTVISGGDDFAIWLWQDGVGHLLGQHLGKVTDLEVSPKGDVVASASWDGTVGIWSLTGGDHVAFDQHDSGFSDVTFSPDGARLYAATSGGDILEYTLARPTAPRTVVRHGFAINEMVIGPDGDWLAYGAVDGVTRVIDPGTGIELYDFTLERRPILAMALDGSTGQLAVGDGHGFIMMVDTFDWKIVRDFRAMRDGPVWALAFDPQGQFIFAGGLDDVIYRWPVAFLDEYDPVESDQRSFLRNTNQMSNGERQFMRKCSICHALDSAASRKAGPTLHGVFGRRAGTLDGYRYSETLRTSDIIWSPATIDALFDEGPDNYIPASKMPMQVIAKPEDRRDLIDYLLEETREREE